VAPLVALGVRGALGTLGANPVETLTHVTGDWALRFLVLSLCVTPARRWLGWSSLAPERRTLGLFAFGYACLHIATYLVFDLGLSFSTLAEDVLERPYITAGFVAFLSLVPLAATSTRASIKRLGHRWRQLHQLAYLAAIAACVHFVWLVKADWLEPAIYAAVVGFLLVLRLPRRQTAV
jgi:sulfoxide reductase heme-binding subunit YedZ